MNYKDIMFDKSKKMQNKTIIQIISLADDNYAQHLAVMIASVLINSEEDEQFNFYIMDGGISEKSKEKLNKLKKIKDFNIEYVTGKNNDYQFCPLSSNYVENTYWRFEIPSFLPHLNKVLLLDSDLIVRGSLKEFWESDLEGYPAGCVENPFSLLYPKRLKYSDEYSYFNAGVMLMDLAKLREFNFGKKCFDFMKNHPERIWHVDQCVINSVLQNKWKRLPYRFNFMSIVPHKNYKQEEYALRNTPDEEVIDAINGNALIAHFIADNKPWEFMGNRLYMDDYWKYLKLTPWKHYIPKDFNFINLLKKIFIGDKSLNKIRKLLGKKVYYYILNKKIEKKEQISRQKAQDKFKKQYPNLDEFKIALSKELANDDYFHIELLNPLEKQSWYEWFMTNTVSEVIISENDYNDTILKNAKLFLKYNGRFIVKGKEQRVLFEKC